MFPFFHKKRTNRINEYAEAARTYISETYVVPKQPVPEASKIHFSRSAELPCNQETIRYYRDIEHIGSEQKSNVKFSDREPLPREEARYSDKEVSGSNDRYNADVLLKAVSMSAYNPKASMEFIKTHINRTFVEQMQYLIGAKRMDSPDVYKKAFIDRKLFSKIQSDPEYKPSKDVCIKIAFALQLNLEETTDLISRAGYALSHGDKRDVVIEYFFMRGIYKLIDINEVMDLLGLKPFDL